MANYGRSEFGRIINIGSNSGLYGNFGQANYCSAKMAVVGLTQSLAQEGRKHNIFVNCVVPNADSRMTATIVPENILQHLDPRHLSPLVAWLVHESCESTGGIFEAGCGFYSQVRIERSGGVVLGSKDSFVTAEGLRDHWDAVTDFASTAVNPPTYPTSGSDAFRTIFHAVTSHSEDTEATVSPLPTSKSTSVKEETSSPSASSMHLQSDYIFEGLQSMVSSDSLK